MSDLRFGQDLLGDEYDASYDVEADHAARGLIWCQECHNEFCVADEFVINWMDHWGSEAQEDVILGDGTNPPLGNNAIRKYLYRQFLFHSKWSPIQKNVRVKLPGCVTLKIRELYPGDQNAYIGHRWRAATNHNTHAVDETGEEHQKLYWVFVNKTWALQPFLSDNEQE